jgi:hypothetical protein
MSDIFDRPPPKPKTEKAQVDQLWDAMFNHLPSTLNAIKTAAEKGDKWQNVKLNFVLGFLVLIMTFLGVIANML